jgi:mono/diheme cytochrome c family protein
MKQRKVYLFAGVLLAVLLLSACGTTYTDEQIASGAELFGGTCSACHGADATGVENLGKDLTSSAFVLDNTDEFLIEFIKVGRPVSDPLNTQGIDMPPKGGNPALDDDDILSLVAYLRALSE